MKSSFQRINYRSLNARQKENYNFQKVSGALADYGFSTIRLSDDWQGADFIAQHTDGTTVRRVQLKARLTFSKKYSGKDLWMCFRDKNDDVYFFPHDEVADSFLKSGRVMTDSMSWEAGAYSRGGIAKWMQPILQKYRIPAKEEPNQALQHNDPGCHVSCLRTPRASRGRG